ncbi:hypothetical protein GCM10022214_04980 [Actinomadura miaoliensis]|uniref:Uncharacterized protein n=1 Tax=Actinomadura miaoliensis TaxID=430685 RepID=A0ABP7UZN3_9ACTN
MPTTIQADSHARRPRLRPLFAVRFLYPAATLTRQATWSCASDCGAATATGTHTFKEPDRRARWSLPLRRAQPRF